MTNTTQLLTTYRLVADFGESYSKIHPYIAVPVCLFAIVTNVLNMVVLSKKELRSATNCLLQAVAVCHLSLNIFYLGSIIHDWYYISDDSSCESHIFTFGWSLGVLLFSHLSFTLHGIGTWITVAMALLRCVQLKTRNNSYANTIIATKVTLFVVIVVVCLCVPNYLAFSINKIPVETVCYSHSFGSDYDKETGGWEIGPSQTGNELTGHSYKTAFQLSAVLFYMMPSCLLIPSFIYLVSTLSKFNRNRQRLLNTMTLTCVHTEHHTIMLVSILSVFLITQLPQGILTFLCSVLSENYRLDVYQSLGQAMELLSIINGLFGFIVYCSMSAIFRTTFIHLFRRARRTAARFSDMSSVDNVKCENCRQCRHPIRSPTGSERHNILMRCHEHATTQTVIVGYKRVLGGTVLQCCSEEEPD